MHTPICYYLSLQLAILLNCKLLKIAIIRTKMWSLKIIQYDLICCAEQLTNNIFILKPETSSLLLLQILHSHFNNFTKHKILHWGKTNNFWTIALSGLPQNHPVCFFFVVSLFFNASLLPLPQRKESKDQELCTGAIPSLYQYF